MAKLYISEYTALADAGGGAIPLTPEPALVDQVVTFTTSTQSSVFNAATRYIRVHTDAICSVLVGTNPTATTSNKRLAADQTEWFGVAPAAKIAVVTNT